MLNEIHTIFGQYSPARRILMILRDEQSQQLRSARVSLRMPGLRLQSIAVSHRLINEWRKISPVKSFIGRSSIQHRQLSPQPNTSHAKRLLINLIISTSPPLVLVLDRLFLSDGQRIFVVTSQPWRTVRYLRPATSNLVH